MKYTKSYPIHPLPDKQFSGASIFADGGPKTKTYTNKAEYEKALQAYNDSLFKFQDAVRDKALLINDLRKEGKSYTDKVFPISKFPGYQESYKNDSNKPVAIGQISIPEYEWDYPLYKKPVVKPEYKSFTTPIMNEGERQMEARYKPTSTLAKGTLEQEVKPTMAKGTMESEPKPINELMMPSGSYMQKDDFIKRYGEKPWLKATGQKFAFGGFKYNNGGTKTTVGNSFYNQSTNQVGSPQVNTVPSSYTDQFNGNYSSTPKTTKDGINFTKDGKAFNTMSTSNSGSAFSGNYLGMATAAVGGIGTTVNNANAATTEQEKNRAIERGTVDTTMNVVDAAFPIVGAVEGVAGGIGAVIDSTNPSTSYTDPNTGKTYNYKKGDSGTSAAGFKAAVDPRGNITNFIGDITGTTENYGQSDFGMGVADLFAPFLSQAFRNKQAEKAANQAQMNNSLMNAQGVDSTARNFSAFGGYKNKFPYGGQLPGDNLTHKDSVAHQADKILKYEQLKGGPGGNPLPYYSDPKYKGMLMDNIYPEVSKIMPNASAMEKGEAMDFIFNAGYDKNSGKITKDPRGYALQEYYRKNDPSKLDAKGNWAGRKGAPYSFDAEYNNTIGKLPENERRILMNKGRDWYYKNTNNPAPGVLSPDYNATWYGRIHNTNDFKEFDPKNPKFTPNQKAYGGNMKSEVTGQSYLKDQVSDFGDSSFKTHKEGGVMVDKVNEVEKPEIIWNDYVFSYQLKDKDGIPFSTRARKLINQIK